SGRGRSRAARASAGPRRRERTRTARARRRRARTSAALPASGSPAQLPLEGHVGLARGLAQRVDVAREPVEVRLVVPCGPLDRLLQVADELLLALDALVQCVRDLARRVADALLVVDEL